MTLFQKPESFLAKAGQKVINFLRRYFWQDAGSPGLGNLLLRHPSGRLSQNTAALRSGKTSIRAEKWAKKCNFQLQQNA